MKVAILVIVFSILLVKLHNQISVSALECSSDGFVYGQNEFVDELLSCSLSKSFDLDLTPSGDHAKSTSKTLVEQGLSNRTTILYARLSGLWTAKRPSFIETGWRCDSGKTTSSSIIELSGLSLEVVERMDAPMSRNQHKLSAHRPCKTFDLPLSMCRQAKPVYRSTSTWVNRAYYNLTLVQGRDETKPSVVRLSLMFTCPETFKQRITYSPSSTYLLMRHSHNGQSRKPVKRNSQIKSSNLKPSVNEIPSLGHANSFTSTQGSNMPASPLYQSSIRVITSEVTTVLQKAFDECLSSLEVNLNLFSDCRTFREAKYSLGMAQHEADEAFRDEVHSGITNECSNKLWIKSRIELANQVNSLANEGPTASHPSGASHPMKRNHIALTSQPDEVGELLNPFGFYHDTSAEQMID